MNQISSIKEISNNYQYFIFDIWGVIHDGDSAYRGVENVIKFLNDQNKNICFLSNAPRRSSVINGVLQSYEIMPKQYDFIMTSGELVFNGLKINQESGYKDYGRNYTYIGPEKDIGLLEGLDYNLVEDASQADFALATGFDHDRSNIEEKRQQLEQALENKLTMICSNPDMTVVKKNGIVMLCAGYLGQEYQKMGGNVVYYGKPHQGVYNEVARLYKGANKSKMLAIGDSLETDIKGANNFDIDSLLLTGGVLSKELSVNYWQDADFKRVKQLCQDNAAIPKYVISNLKL